MEDIVDAMNRSKHEVARDKRALKLIHEYDPYESLSLRKAHHKIAVKLRKQIKALTPRAEKEE